MKTPRNPFSDEPETIRAQHFYLTLAVICLFLLILLRLWYLQLIRGPEYRLQSENNRTRVQDIFPPRGLIMDRNGEILVDNSPAFELAVVREDVDDPDVLTAKLAYYLGLPLPDLQARYDKIRSQPAFKPAVLVSDVDHETMVSIETNRFSLPGVVMRVKPRRRYRYDGLAAHIIGYLGEITQKQIEQDAYQDHRIGDLIGQYGIEKEWESDLHGKRGRRMVEVDASGRLLRVIKKKDPIPGDNLHLTIDTRLQKVAQDALGGQIGAIVAMDPNNGEVLAMASTPAFPQASFVQGMTAKDWQALLKDPFHPLENRAISGQYPPGSTFKIVAAVAALEEGVVTPETTIGCNGSYSFGDRVFHCWSRVGHGPVNLYRSLKESCDIYYYDVGRRLGVDRLAHYARLFGLGEITGVGLATEKPGLFPTKAWKLKRFNTPWQAGETLSVVIGQGYNLATPLQMAQVVSVIANGGLVIRPRLVRRITRADGVLVKEFKPEIVRQTGFRPETIALVRKSLAAVVNEPGGTGQRCRMDDVLVGGKSGTSQVVALKKYQGIPQKDLPYEYQDHAWFVAFAPVDNPRIAVAAVVEHAGHGGTAAAPLVRAVLQAFFHPNEEVDMPATLSADVRFAPGD